MSNHRSVAFGAAGLAVLSAVIVACSSSTSPSLSSDPRCGGIAHVPAWQMSLGVTFADSRAVDTFSIRLHRDLQPTAVTGALIDPVVNDTGNAYRGWITGVPTGTMGVHDTVINTMTPDTVTGTASKYVTGSSMYFTVDLKTCTATIGGIFQAPDTLTDSGAVVAVDTAEVGYVVIANVPVDSATAVNGLVNAGMKAYTIAIGTPDFTHLPLYIPGGLTGFYVLHGGSQVLDSATVGYIITAASTPATVQGNPAPAAPRPSGRSSALLAPGSDVYYQRP